MPRVTESMLQSTRLHLGVARADWRRVYIKMLLSRSTHIELHVTATEGVRDGILYGGIHLVVLWRLSGPRGNGRSETMQGH